MQLTNSYLDIFSSLRSLFLGLPVLCLVNYWQIFTRERLP